MEGVIRSLKRDKAFGFIRAKEGGDFFFHASACVNGTRYDELREGDAVEFEETESEKGPRAERVMLV